MNIKWFLILLLFFGISSAQKKSFASEDISINSTIDSNLLLPKK